MQSSLSTIKFLLRTGAIPYLVVDYTPSSISLVLHREGKDYYCQLMNKIDDLCFCELCVDAITVKAQMLLERELENYIVQATQLQLSMDLLTSDFFEDALAYANSVHNLYLATVAATEKEDNSFSETDFDVLSRLAKEMRDNNRKDK